LLIWPDFHLDTFGGVSVSVAYSVFVSVSAAFAVDVAAVATATDASDATRHP